MIEILLSSKPYINTNLKNSQTKRHSAPKMEQGAAFVYSLIQLLLGIVVDGLFAWGLTPVMLIGTILLDYILAFSVLGVAGLFAKKAMQVYAQVWHWQ